MMMVLFIVAAIIVVLVAVGLIVGAGSRVARKRGMDQSPPPANVKVIERH